MRGQFAIFSIVCFCFLPNASGAGEAELGKLAKIRLEAAEKAYKAWYQASENQPVSDMLYHLSVRWLTAELEVAGKKEERVAAHSAHRKRMYDWEKMMITSKGATPGNAICLVIESYQKEAEYWLEKERSAKR